MSKDNKQSRSLWFLVKSTGLGKLNLGTKRLQSLMALKAIFVTYVLSPDYLLLNNVFLIGCCVPAPLCLHV